MCIRDRITSLNMTVASIVTAIKNRPRAEYAEPQREHKDTAQAIVDTVATHHIEHVQRAEQRRASRMSEFDLPVDDPPQMCIRDRSIGCASCI